MIHLNHETLRKARRRGKISIKKKNPIKANFFFSLLKLKIDIFNHNKK